MTYAELLKLMEAYALVMPHILDQKLFDIKVSTTGNIEITLEESRLSIPIS